MSDDQVVDHPEESRSLPPLPLGLQIFGWYGTLAILGAYMGNSHGWLETGVTYHLLNVSGAIGVGWVALRRRAWQPFSLELAWALIGLSALFQLLT